MHTLFHFCLQTYLEFKVLFPFSEPTLPGTSLVLWSPPSSSPQVPSRLEPGFLLVIHSHPDHIVLNPKTIGC
jgi:hypothetical protein